MVDALLCGRLIQLMDGDLRTNAHDCGCGNDDDEVRCVATSHGWCIGSKCHWIVKDWHMTKARHASGMGLWTQLLKLMHKPVRHLHIVVLQS
jgi:hypothetical protein